jgi:hypothetical protein
MHVYILQLKASSSLRKACNMPADILLCGMSCSCITYEDCGEGEGGQLGLHGC